MDKEQALELYGNVPLKFSEYYKHSFTFKGIAEDNNIISARYWGDSGDGIYRYHVTANEELTLNEHYPDSLDAFTVYSIEGKIIYES